MFNFPVEKSVLYHTYFILSPVISFILFIFFNNLIFLNNRGEKHIILFLVLLITFCFIFYIYLFVGEYIKKTSIIYINIVENLIMLVMLFFMKPYFLITMVQYNIKNLSMLYIIMIIYAIHKLKIINAQNYK